MRFSFEIGHKTDVNNIFKIILTNKISIMKTLGFRFSTVISALMLATILLVGCKKDEVVTPTLSAEALDVTAASSTTDQVIVDMQTMSEEATGTSKLKVIAINDSSIVPSRSMFTINTDSTTIKIDFGTGTLCRDGKTRKGQLYISRANPPSKDRTGGEIRIITSGYEVNGYKVSLTKIITCTGWFTSATYPSGYLEYTVVISNGQIIRPNGDDILVNVNHTRKLLAAKVLKMFAGWAISGTSSQNLTKFGANQAISVKTTITRDLVRPLKYHHFVAGEYVSTFLSGKTVTVDYGSGSLYEPTTWGSKTVTKSDGAESTATQE